MAWPKYAARFKDSKQLLVQLLCRGCNAQRFALPSKESWAVGDSTVTAKCMRCGHVQSDAYNWLRLS